MVKGTHMSHPETHIRYAALEMPAAGELTQIAPGVFWVRMPLPFALDHINLWLVEDKLDGREGWTVIDTGASTEPTRAAWVSIFERHLGGKPILRVICTHFHPDHLGLAGWLCAGADDRGWSAQLWMNYAEYAAARVWVGTGSKNQGDTAHTNRIADVQRMIEYVQRHGVNDPETLEKLQKRRDVYPSLVPEVPASFRRIFPRESIRVGPHHWHVVPGYGHSPEHCALYCEALNLVISGDMVLPRISTNMSVWAQEPDADPLRLYLDSLHNFDQLPDDVLVLPSHGKPFGAAPGTQMGGLKTRTAQLREHHDARLEETLSACAQPVTAAQVMPILFKRELDSHQLTFALGETISHLNYLWHAGQIRRSLDNGCIRFVRA